MKYILIFFLTFSVFAATPEERRQRLNNIFRLGEVMARLDIYASNLGAYKNQVINAVDDSQLLALEAEYENLKDEQIAMNKPQIRHLKKRAQIGVNNTSLADLDDPVKRLAFMKRLLIILKHKEVKH